MLFTAKAAVSWSTPTLTHPELAARSKTPYGTARPNSLIREIMDPDFFRVTLGAIFAPVVAEIPDQFLFLGVDGDHRLLFSQRGGHLGIDVAELRIPVGVAVAFRGLAVALQTVTRLIEQVADQGAADLVTLRFQRLRQAAHALAGPPQRRLRITAGRRFDQGFEIGKQRRVLENRRLTPGSRPPNPF